MFLLASPRLRRVPIVLAFFWLTAGCGEPVKPNASEETLDEVAHILVEAIEARQPGAVLDYVAYEFKSADDLDYGAVTAIVDSFLLRHPTVSAELENVEVSESEPRRGTVRALVAFAAAERGPGGSMPADAVRYQFDLDFAKRGRRWQAISGTYARQSPSE